jgi:hypothetical protein
MIPAIQSYHLPSAVRSIYRSKKKEKERKRWRERKEKKKKMKRHALRNEKKKALGKVIFG